MLTLTILFSGLGGVFKILGGVLYGSKAVFVDAMTSVANLMALLLAVRYWRDSLKPPDEDHHFGHYKLAFGGSISTLMIYSFVAGVVTLKLVELREYTVSLEAPLMAFLGVSCYLIAIAISRRLRGAFTHYSKFTVSELIEGVVVITSSLAGALLSYLIDYAGALFLTLYIFYELRDVFSEVMEYVGDRAPSPDVARTIREEFSKNNLSLSSLRLRNVDGTHYQGVATVLVSPDEDMMSLSRRVDEVKKSLRDHRVDLVVEFKLRTQEMSFEYGE
jgi:divalent metal cation (Fe/Co/Zn/Cd) transporter